MAKKIVYRRTQQKSKAQKKHLKGALNFDNLNFSVRWQAREDKTLMEFTILFLLGLVIAFVIIYTNKK